MLHKPLAKAIAHVMKEFDRLPADQQQQTMAFLVARYGLPVFVRNVVTSVMGEGGEGPNKETHSLISTPLSSSSSSSKSSSSSEAATTETTTTGDSSKTSETTATSKDLRKRPVPALTEGFLKFWRLYPSKVGKHDAIRVWIRCGFESKTNEILLGLERNRSYLIRDGGKFIPNPATWLNQGRWEDVPRTFEPTLTDKTARNADAARAFVERGTPRDQQ